MTKILPVRPNLDHLKRQAKQTLRAHKRGDAAVCPLLRHLHHLSHASDQEILATQLQLHDVQFALAISYGFSSWRTLRDHVVTTPDEIDSGIAFLNPESLADTLNAVTDAFTDGIPISPTERERVALWLAQRQGQPGTYHGFSAPTPQDYHGAARLYTGEALNTRASIGHILGEEAARCLIQLHVTHREVQQAINRNVEIVESFNFRDENRGFYCCCKCSPAYWRYLHVSEIPAAETRIGHGIRVLTQSREENGRWRSFPFFYTLFALLDIDLPEAIEELRYAVPACERIVRRTITDSDRVAKRRRDIAQRVLAKCS